MSTISFLDKLWQDFERCRGYTNDEFAGKRLRQEENERFYYEGDFFKKVSPETRNILRHIREVGFLRPPQVDAFELYVYLKEIQGNSTIKELYRRLLLPEGTQLDVLSLTAEQLEEIKQKKALLETLDSELQGLAYSNWLFALGMGTGKTILMATMIFYDFILAEHYPEDGRFAKNALVFAPDTTIIDSLREIQDFDYSKVIPQEYALFLSSNLKFHYLSDVQTELSVLPGSAYNIIVSNVQKIILKKQGSNSNGQQTLFPVVKDMEGEWKVNNRLRKLEQLDNLAVFVDEAHHAFGTSITNDLKRVRETINRLDRKSPLTGCINLTGTPYVNGKMLPEVVFFYSIKQAIDDGHLKQVKFIDYANTKTEEFIRDVVDRFWHQYGEERREGLLPKIAFYCTTISELEDEFRPLLEKVLAEKSIPLTKILVNHSEVEDENIRRFRLLDTPESEDQFILLVGKGTEGWNCRSLFATAMYRRPRSKVFLLQSSLRCLRAIGDMPQTAIIFLSTENRAILESEIQKNLGTTMSELEGRKNKRKVTIQKRKDVKIKLAKQRVKVLRQYQEQTGQIKLALDEYYTNHKNEFVGLVTEREMATNGQKLKLAVKDSQTLQRRQKRYTLYTLVEEISRYTHLPCLKVEKILRNSDMCIEGCLAWVNRENRLIEVIVRCILDAVFRYEVVNEVEWEEVELAKNFPVDWVVEEEKRALEMYDGRYPNSFHIEPYIFDNESEKRLFEHFVEHKEIEEIYYTGGITDVGHNEFYVEYYDELEGRWRRYYPDFILKLKNNGWAVVEVKQADQTAHPNVVAKEQAARELFEKLNSIRYAIKRDDEIRRGMLQDILQTLS